MKPYKNIKGEKQRAMMYQMRTMRHGCLQGYQESTDLDEYFTGTSALPEIGVVPSEVQASDNSHLIPSPTTC